VCRRAYTAQAAHLSYYVTYLQHPWRMLWTNFISGVARGIGTAVGFSVLGALLIYLLRWLAYENLPVIGDFIAKIVQIVETQGG